MVTEDRVACVDEAKRRESLDPRSWIRSSSHLVIVMSVARGIIYTQGCWRLRGLDVLGC